MRKKREPLRKRAEEGRGSRARGCEERGGGGRWTTVTQVRRTSTRAPRRGRESACQARGGGHRAAGRSKQGGIGRGGVGGAKERGKEYDTADDSLIEQGRSGGCTIGEFRKRGFSPNRPHCDRVKGHQEEFWRLGGGGEHGGSSRVKGRWEGKEPIGLQLALEGRPCFLDLGSLCDHLPPLPCSQEWDINNLEAMLEMCASDSGSQNRECIG